MPGPLAAIPAIAAMVARGAAVVGRVASVAGQAVARGAGAVARGVGAVGSRVGGAAGRAARAAGNTRAGGFARQVGVRARLAVRNGNRAFQQAMQPRRGRSTRPAGSQGSVRQRRRQVPTMGQSWRRAVQQGAMRAARSQRSGGGTFGRMFSPRTYLGRIAGNVGSAKMNFRQGNNLAGTLDSLKVAKDVGGPVLGTLAATAVAIATMPKIVKEFGAALIESKRHLGEVNAAYSVAAGRLDIQRFQRNVRLANATSGSFTSLTRSQNRLEDKLMPYAITGSNALLKLANVAVNTGTAMIKVAEFAAKISGWEPIISALGRWLNWDMSKPDNHPLADLGVAIARGNLVERQRPPMPAGNRPAQR